jgi:hypothetical protein
VIATDTELCAPLRDTHDVKKGHGRAAYYMEKDKAIRTQYHEIIAEWNAYSAERLPSDNEEDLEASDSNDSD